jgi:hypothetical protein
VQQWLKVKDEFHFHPHLSGPSLKLVDEEADLRELLPR